ncbi:hypothetical protein XMD420_001821 [Marinobacterium sp. xm-d-420]|uniref:hypothetical protein n=1 Tax=Marinobacterium sp. xm-d-420 TaxID=2497737 RepID=UPI0015685458|nr:hypothetical protein [Marinobacterium sp. xm-d-420]NRP28215.1 hypothetical protein [Marinobacterium sp. xm-d-420]
MKLVTIPLILFPCTAFASNTNAETWVALVFAVILGAITIAVSSSNQKKLDDPNDTSMLLIEDVSSASNLKPAKEFLIRIYRQSGNEHQPDRVVSAEDGSDVPPDEAIKVALQTLRRARIDSVFVVENTNDILHIRRPMHSHGGKAEGKKVGGAVVIKVQED